MYKKIEVVHTANVVSIPVTRNDNLIEDHILNQLDIVVPESTSWTLDEKIDFLELLVGQNNDAREYAAA